MIDFTLPDHDGNLVSRSDFAGRQLVIFFYPAAMTPGCTTEACDFRDNHQALIDAGYAVVGVSPDQPSKNARFREKEGLPFPLLSDEDHVFAESLGAWGLKKNYGKEYEGLIRSTFVVGPDGEMLHEFRNIKATGHVARLIRELGLE